jgi:uncharacterized protein (DUF58 family)
VNTNLEVTYRGKVLLLLGILAAIAAWINPGGSSVRLAAAVLLAPLLIDLIWGGVRLPELRLIMRRRRTESGAPFTESFTLHNLSRRRAVMDLHLREPRTDTYAGGLFVHHIEPEDKETLRIPARTRTRGLAGQRAVVVLSSYPLGLIRRSALLRSHTELISEPTRMPLPHHVANAFERDEPEYESRQTPGDDEFHSLRQYVSGEEARMVHAMRSAAMGTLVRRVMRSQQQREACLILDLRRPPGRSATLGSRRLEWSLGAAATIVDAMLERNAVLTCLVIGETDRRWTLSSPDEYEEFLAFLAQARPVLHRRVSREFLEEVKGFDTTLWVPAGGFKATDDRNFVEQPVLVTEWEPVP